MVAAVIGGDETGEAALASLRRARRAHRAADFDIFDAFYQAYLTAVGCGVAVLLGSDAVGDHRVGVTNVARVADRGPAFVGLVVAVAIAIGLRSGARGGPLVLPAADVRHVLMAPVSRAAALRGPAVRQTRFAAFVGLVGGAGLGVLSARRLPGPLLSWAVCGALAGLLAGMAVTGLALVCSGRRIGVLPASATALILVGWTSADVAAHARTSPTTLLGELALWPVQFHALALLALLLPVAAAGAGIAWVGGTSIEAAERRASLASQIRFALTLQDLRTVVLLRRQLTQERPRSRPWLPVRPLSRGRNVVWRRDLHGLARWPAARIGRVIILGVIGGVAACGAWAGTTPLIVVAALAFYVAALDALEPLAQEIDHPDLPNGAPVELGRLRLLHVPVSVATLVLIAGAGWAAAFVVAPANIALPVGAAMLVPAALSATAGAAVSIVMAPPVGSSLVLPAEVAGVRMALRVLWGPALVVVGLTPLFVAHSAYSRHVAPGPAAVSGAILPIMVAVLAFGWLRLRETIHASMKGPAPA